MNAPAKAKHTPGPWKATLGISETDALRCGVTAVRGNVEYLLATIENGAPGDFCETEAANARLIAAAPELLVALKGLKFACQHMLGYFDAADLAAFEAASLAIRKAEPAQ